MDLLTRFPDDVAPLHIFLTQFATQPWRGRRRYAEHKSTVYFGRAWQGRNMAIYSKASECRTRLEIRIFGAANCRRYSVGDCRSLLNQDLVSIIRRNARISVLDWQKVERRINRCVNATMRASGQGREDAQRRIQTHIARCLQTEHCLPTRDEFPSRPVQAWIDYLPYIAKGAVRTMPLDALINASDRPVSPQTIDA